MIVYFITRSYFINVATKPTKIIKHLVRLENVCLQNIFSLFLFRFVLLLSVSGVRNQKIDQLCRNNKHERGENSFGKETANLQIFFMLLFSPHIMLTIGCVFIPTDRLKWWIFSNRYLFSYFSLRFCSSSPSPSQFLLFPSYFQ